MSRDLLVGDDRFEPLRRYLLEKPVLENPRHAKWRRGARPPPGSVKPAFGTHRRATADGQPRTLRRPPGASTLIQRLGAGRLAGAPSVHTFEILAGDPLAGQVFSSPATLRPVAIVEVMQKQQAHAGCDQRLREFAMSWDGLITAARLRG
jgi:hypothetical protein